MDIIYTDITACNIEEQENRYRLLTVRNYRLRVCVCVCACVFVFVCVCGGGGGELF